MNRLKISRRNRLKISRRNRLKISRRNRLKISRRNRLKITRRSHLLHYQWDKIDNPAVTVGGMMTIHPLHGGDGYAYLTRQVAAHDNTVAVGSGTRLTDYYQAHGEPPGIWAGRGIEALGVSGIVREDQMASLFGEGLHPDADRRPGLDNQLGRRAPVYKGNSEFRKACDAAIESFRADPRPRGDAGRAGRGAHGIATRMLSEEQPGCGVVAGPGAGLHRRRAGR